MYICVNFNLFAVELVPVHMLLVSVSAKQCKHSSHIEDESIMLTAVFGFSKKKKGTAKITAPELRKPVGFVLRIT